MATAPVTAPPVDERQLLFALKALRWGPKPGRRDDPMMLAGVDRGFVLSRQLYKNQVEWRLTADGHDMLRGAR